MSQSEPEPLNTEGLTWAALLARWVDFARSALALPEDDVGRRLRDSVADIIMLQAVWFALDQMDQLSADQCALGLDRAEILIDKHSAALTERWRDQSLPALLVELVDDARNRLDAVSRQDRLD